MLSEYDAVVAFFNDHTYKGDYTGDVKELLDSVSILTHDAIKIAVDRGNSAISDIW
jgi:hypothetical protein